MHTILKRTWAEIDLDRLRHNWETIRRVVHKDTRMMAVVKADAYGHGAVTVSRVLDSLGADCFAVSNLDEAIQLRDAGIKRPLLILSYTPPAEAATLARYGITQTVISADYAAALSAAATAANVNITVHIKIDTGMSRVGFVHHHAADRETVAAAVIAAAKLPHLCAEGIFTHFASADEQDDCFVKEQFSRFMQTVEDAAAGGVHFAVRHCANSAAIERFPEMQLDMVRPGIILYGLAPDDSWMHGLLPLQPVMQLKTVISMVKTLPAGETLSYNRTYTTARETTVATVPIGYADGYARTMSNTAHMLLHGKKVPVIGRVCMDQCMLDVSGVPARVGDIVTVFGDALTTEQYAAWMHTINYEAVCLIGKRVPRVYMENGEAVGYEGLLTEHGGAAHE